MNINGRNEVISVIFVNILRSVTIFKLLRVSWKKWEGLKCCGKLKLQSDLHEQH